MSNVFRERRFFDCRPSLIPFFVKTPCRHGHGGAIGFQSISLTNSLTIPALGDACQRHLRASGGDHPARRVTIDIDSFPIVVHGQQPGAAYNCHYQETVYHPLVASYSVAGKYDSMQAGHRLGNGFVHALLTMVCARIVLHRRAMIYRSKDTIRSVPSPFQLGHAGAGNGLSGCWGV